ncbi:GntR family transcriptional regulator [Streptosporangium sp. NPDC000396]|uniref:GntR family transcriptional regulator n=1 Tax=Streptosporangium sp. NPDC000396 TaxID=3366185 RepID=UPI0036A222B6
MMADSPQAMAPYRRIAAQIRARIERGEIRPGDRIPSVREIMRDEGVSTATATRVAAVLRAEGYAESVPGIGTIASLPKKLTTGPDRLQLLRATGSGYRPSERAEILSAELVSAPEEIADALGVEEGASVIRRRRAYYDDGGVVALSTSWLPGELAEAAPELLIAEPLPAMTFGLVEDRTGRRVVRRRDIVAIKPVPEDVSPVLGVENGLPALTMTNCYWDQHGDVTEYAVDFLGPGRELSADHALD